MSQVGQPATLPMMSSRSPQGRTVTIGRMSLIVPLLVGVIAAPAPANAAIQCRI
jgi:hypothetical protein